MNIISMTHQDHNIPKNAHIIQSTPLVHPKFPFVSQYPCPLTGRSYLHRPYYLGGYIRTPARSEIFSKSYQIKQMSDCIWIGRPFGS